MATLIRRLGSDGLRQWLPLATLIVLVALIGALQPVFLQPATLLELAGDTAVLFILATGVTFVIMLGGIDLSIQSMASLASVVVAITLSSLGYWSFVLAVALGALAGLLSGFAHPRLRSRRSLPRWRWGACSSRPRSLPRGRSRSRSKSPDEAISTGHRRRPRRPERGGDRADRAHGRARAAGAHPLRALYRPGALRSAAPRRSCRDWE